MNQTVSSRENSRKDNATYIANASNQYEAGRSFGLVIPTPGHPPIPEIPVQIKENLENGTAQLNIDKHPTQIKTLDELIKVCQIDTNKWKVTKWNCAARPGNKGEEAMKYSVSAEMKRPEPSLADQQMDFLGQLYESLSVVHKPTPRKGPGRSVPKALTVYLSDMHIGAHTVENSMYENPYEASVIHSRMDIVIQGIVDQVQLHGRFEKLFLMNLGDVLDGWNGQTTRGGHQLPQNMSNVEQFNTFVETHRRLIDTLVELDVASSIEYVATSSDNHSGCFGEIAMRALEIYLSVKHPQIRVTISDKFLSHFAFGEHCIVYSHGKDPSDRKFGLPLNLDPKTENYLNDYFDFIKPPQTYWHVVKGDLHQSNTNHGKRFRYKNVLSFYGAGRWIHTNFGRSKAGVDFDVYSKYTNEILSGQFWF